MSYKKNSSNCTEDSFLTSSSSVCKREFERQTINEISNNTILKMISSKLVQLEKDNNNLKSEVNRQINHQKNWVRMFIILLGVALFAFAMKNQEGQQLRQIQTKYDKLIQKVDKIENDNLQLKLTAQNLQMVIQKLRETINALADQLIDIHMSEFSKQEQSMKLLEKYSNKFKFEVDQTIPWLTQQFSITNKGKVTKIQESQKIFFSREPILQNGLSHFSIKILKSLSKKISVGILPYHKRSQDCIYCESSDIYYIWGYNGNIYNGEYLKLMNKSKKTKFTSIEINDIVTMFINFEKAEIIWYINGKFAGKQIIAEHLIGTKLYPFVEVTNKGDQIQILM